MHSWMPARRRMCIAYGPGRLVLAHQPDEHVSLEDLLAATKVLATLVVRLLA